VGLRAERKRETRERILEAASRVLRRRGLEGAGVATIMKEAGLTHGGFYVHFRSRRELVAEMLGDAFRASRQRFARGVPADSGLAWVRAAVARYLSPRHRDAPEAGCPIPALAGDLAREDAALRRVFDEELESMARGFGQQLRAGGADEPDERALALVALLAGGVTLARAVSSRRLSNRILRACRDLAERDLEEAG
jgi:TetR/AcrR family transcriptional repressor of nem operon